MNIDKVTIFIDALPLAPAKMSGIGHLTLEMLRAMGSSGRVRLVLVVPLGKAGLVRRHSIPNSEVKTILMPARVFSVLLQMKLLPPVDLFIGKGAYLFPNYRNWPLYKSQSFTYIHDAAFLKFPETVKPKNLTYLKKNIRIWLKRADTILTLSESSKRDLVEVLSVQPDKVRIIPCGVDHSVFIHRPPEEVANTKKKYGLKADKYVLYIGNFEPRKNLDRLLEAYSVLPVEQRDSYVLVMVGGGGWLNEQTLLRIKSMQEAGLNILKIDTYVEDNDLPALISGASALVQPSIYEGFGIPPLQAMACGTPVAVANNSSLPEVVEDAGVYFDAYDVHDISDQLSKVLADNKLRSTLIEKGLHQSEKFSWTSSASKLIDCIESKP